MATFFDPGYGEGDGLKSKPYEPDAFLTAIREAVEYFEAPKRWKKIVKNGMKADYPWDRSARVYVGFYESPLQS